KRGEVVDGDLAVDLRDDRVAQVGGVRTGGAVEAGQLEGAGEIELLGVAVGDLRATPRGPQQREPVTRVREVGAVGAEQLGQRRRLRRAEQRRGEFRAQTGTDDQGIE